MTAEHKCTKHSLLPLPGLTPCIALLHYKACYFPRPNCRKGQCNWSYPRCKCFYQDCTCSGNSFVESLCNFCVFLGQRCDGPQKTAVLGGGVSAARGGG